MSAWTPWTEDRDDAVFRLYCLPYAGGGASMYRPWYLASRSTELEVVPVELPGRGTRYREPLMTDFSALLRRMLDEFVPEILDGPPYCLFGHCFGALLAFELATHLVAGNDPKPAHLFVSGATPPEWRDARPMSEMTDDGLTGALDRLGGTPDEVISNPGLMEFFLPIMRADAKLVESYPRRELQPLPMPISALRGSSDRTTPQAEVANWESLTTAGFDMQTVEGDHFFVRANSPEVLGLIRERLSVSQEDAPL